MDKVTPEFLYVMGVASIIAGITLCTVAVVWRYTR